VLSTLVYGVALANAASACNASSCPLAWARAASVLLGALLVTLGMGNGDGWGGG